MKAFVQFVALILAALLAMAVLAYPVWLGVAPLLEEPRFHRVASRVGMLALLVGFVLLARRLTLADRASLGYGVPRARFLRDVALALALGIALMLPVVAIMAGLDLRALRPGVPLDAATLATLAAKGLIGGLVVATIEETFFRGAMFTAIERQWNARAAIVLSALVYAAVHFFARHRIAADEVAWSSGFALLAGTLQAFASPGAIADAFLSLFAVGLLLGAVRAATGNIAACIGLHAGWVWLITFVRETSAPDRDAALAFLLSRHDGFVGWLVLGWTVVIGSAGLRWLRARTAEG